MPSTVLSYKISIFAVFMDFNLTVETFTYKFKKVSLYASIIKGSKFLAL